jgi:sugar phosphate isomerase/epimerase
MRDAPVALGVTLGPLGTAAEGMALAAAWGLAAVQFDAADPNLRPREMSESARRDLCASLRRRGLVASGIDCFVPVERFGQASRVERSIDAVLGCLTLAETLGRVPVCVHLPAEGSAAQSLLHEADRRGVPLVDFTRNGERTCVGLDPAATLAAGEDPVAEVHRSAGRVGAARVVDLLASGMRGPIGEPAGSRLDALSWRLALEMGGFRGVPVIDVRQWTQPHQGVRATIDRWLALLPTAGAAS